MTTPPQKILILGSGVFGLSTALSLSLSPHYTQTQITLVDRSPFPSPDGSSIDTSRIIRADYHDPTYASLASLAQSFWRQSRPQDLGGEGRYRESGLVLVADEGKQGEGYVRGSLENVRGLMAASGGENGEMVRELRDRVAIEGVVGTGGGSGFKGYVNWGSGWADAEAGMRWLRSQVEATGRVEFICAEATELIKEEKQGGRRKVTGVKLTDGTMISADLTILATGAWTGKLVDLRGRATATGQVLVYLDLTAEEQEELGKMPVLLNMSTGLFIIPPANRILKVARHAYGYLNPTSIENPDVPGEMITVSLPRTSVDEPGQWVPKEGEDDCRRALMEMIPSLADRPFTKSRVCWYTDTATGDFMVTYHPEFEGLFLATGGSGHGYKFLPVIGDKIVDCIEGRCPEEFKEKWCWRKETVKDVSTQDGSRGGKPGLIFETEMRRGR